MKKILSTALFLCGFVGAVFAQSDLQPIAEVTLSKRTPITLGQLKQRVRAYENEAGRALTYEQRRTLLDGLINEILFYQAAEREGIQTSDTQVNAAFGDIIASQVGKPMTEAEFAKFIRDNTNMSLDEYMREQNGMTVAEYKAFLKNQITAQLYVAKVRGDEIRNIAPPTDGEIRGWYEMNKQSLVQPDTAKLFLVGVPTTDPQAQSKIEGFKKRLEADPASAEKIRAEAKTAKPIFFADTVYVSKTELAAYQLGVNMDAIMQIFSMKKNQVSSISKTEDSLQCFMFESVQDARILQLSDEVQPGTSVTVYEYIKQMLLNQKQQAALAKAVESLTAELRKPANFKILKSDAELKNLLSW